MNIDIYDNAEELYTGKNISFTSEMPRFYIVRVTVKEGETQIINPFGTSCVMMNNGLSDDFIYPTSSLTQLYTVGDEIIYYINPKHNSGSGFFQVFSSAVIGNFLSKVKTLHDPLPIFIKTDTIVKIDSEDFEAPNGLLLSPSAPIFSGSTFKTAPKIWADGSLDGVYHFPPAQYTVPISDSSIYRPFANCPNLTKISKQGKLGANIKTLGMIDLTYEDDNGYVRLDAYPECIGTPEVVVSYVPPMPDKIVKLSSIPNTLINTKKLKKLHLPFHFREYLIDDTISSLQLPLAGLDFKDLEMESCTIDNMNFSLDSSLISDEDKDFTLTLPMLGIVAPKSVKLCENLHTLHMSISDRGYWEPESESLETQSAWLAWAQENKNHLLTPQYISDNISYGWGENLKKYYDENQLWDYIDENCLPLLPTGVKRLTGYMAKNFILNGFVDYDDEGGGNYNVNYYPMVGYDRSLGEFVRFSDEQRWLHKDGEPFLFVMKPITLSDDNDSSNNQITGAYRNLYANLFIDEELVIPSIPKNCNYIIGWCQGLFANAQGFGGYYKTRPETGEDKAKAIVSWAKSFYKARTDTPANNDWGFNTIELLENSEILEAIDNKNSDYNFVMLAKNNLPQNWYRAKLMVENEVDTKTRLYAYNAYDSDVWQWDENVEYPKNTSPKNTLSTMITMSTSNVNENWGENEEEDDDEEFSNEDGRKETNFQKTFKINNSAGLEQLIEEYKNKYSVSIRVNKWNHGVIFDEELPLWLSSISNAYNQVFFGASVDFEKQETFPKSADLDYAYQNLSKAFITRNFFFTYARPHTFSGYVERDDLEYTIPIIERTQRMTTCYWYQIMIYYNNFTHLELADEEENLFPGMMIINSLAPTRNASYTRQYQGAINKELFEEGYEVEAQQILTNNGVITPLNTIVSLTDTQFLDADAYSKRLQYAAAYDYKYIDKFEHRIKCPSATTSASSFLVKCHLMNIWTNTFKTVPARTYFRTRNNIANVDNFSNRVTMRPVNSDAYA